MHFIAQFVYNNSVYACTVNSLIGTTSCKSGLQITAGQRTMSGQNWVLTGQILVLPDILSDPLPTRSEKF